MSQHTARASALLALVLLGSGLLAVPAAGAAPSAFDLSPSPATIATAGEVRWDLSQVHSVSRGGVDVDEPVDHQGDVDDPDDLRWEVFTNPAYQCQGDGDFWFLLVERVADAPPRTSDGSVVGAGTRQPLLVGFAGLNLGVFLPGGSSLPPPGAYADEPVGAVVAGADQATLDAQSEAIRRALQPGTLEAGLLADGWRGLSPGTCDTDAYAGLGTPYPNHPDASQTVDGALASSAAIEHVVTSNTGVPAGAAPDAPLRPTSDIVLLGTSAGAIGAHAVAQTLRTTATPGAPDGIAVSGVILDSGIISDHQLEIWTADDGARLPPTIPTPAFLAQVLDKVRHPTLDHAGHVDEMAADGSDVPVLAVYDLRDAACGGGPGTPPLTAPEDPSAFDGELCRYAFSALAAAAAHGGADPRTTVHEYDETGGGFAAHGLLDQRGHPAVAAARAWVEELVASETTTPWPHLPVHRLSQVSQDPWSDRAFVDAVSWAAELGIVAGYDGAACGADPSPCFGPMRPVSRQAAAAFLRRLTGAPADVARTSPGAPFRDVGPAHPFVADIAWMAEQGLTTGYADGTFRPATPITRQSAAALLHRLAGSPSAGAGPAFADVGPDHPFAEAIRWMASTGISTGYADGTFRPGAVVTRRAMVVFLHRMDLRSG
jgi:hypothetical protein